MVVKHTDVKKNQIRVISIFQLELRKIARNITPVFDLKNYLKKF